MGLKLYVVYEQARGADQMRGIFLNEDQADEMAETIEWAYVTERETDDK
jgi:hypothetical protein